MTASTKCQSDARIGGNRLNSACMIVDEAEYENAHVCIPIEEVNVSRSFCYYLHTVAPLSAASVSEAH